MKSIFYLFKNKNIPKNTELGLLSSIVNFNKLLNVLLVLLLLFSISKQDKPPVLIRETAHDIFYTENYVADTKVNEFDIKLFVKHFVEKINLFDTYSLEKNLPDALNMMTPSLRASYKSKVIPDGVLRDVLELNTRSNIHINSYSIQQKSKFIQVSLIYNREIIPLDSANTSVQPLRAEIIIEVLDKRSKDYPYGLRIKAFQEFKVG
jgi:hypothetical protein